MAEVKDFQIKIVPNWCRGCGHYAVLAAIQRALAQSGREPHEVALVSGIGCSGRISGYLNVYGFHSTHGRALPVAQGLKLANRKLTVIACSGDGDGFAIGTNHAIHAIRRNIDITYIVMDNHVYGLTKGQVSPRSDWGFKTKTTPTGAIEAPLNIMGMALAAGATFLAQGFSANLPQLTELIVQGLAHKGFALINVFSPCVTFNHVNTYAWFKEHITDLAGLPGYDPSDKNAAMQAINDYQGLITGLIYRDSGKPCYEDLLPGYASEPLSEATLRLSADQFAALLASYK